MREDDAALAGFFAGDAVQLVTEYGRITTQVLIDNDLSRGTVAMSHGFGQQRSFSLQVAQRNPGANCNALMPVGQGTYEPLSYMSWLSGIPVTVVPIPG